MQRLEYVGLLTSFRERRAISAATPQLNPTNLPIVSPWESSRLSEVVYNDIFGTTYRPINRAQAMALPAVARARNLLVSTICRLPMLDYVGETETAEAGQPTWLYATDGGSPIFRLAWTVDDLIFYGFSVWSRINNADGSLQRADRLDKSRWQFDGDGHVLVDGVIAKQSEIIVIPGLHEGILTYGRGVIQDTATLYANIRKRLASPVPPIDLHQTSGDQLTNDEIDALVSRWIKARQSENGAVGYTNPSIEAKVLDVSSDSQLMIEARNAASLDLARLVGVAASRIDSTVDKSSLNYETTTGRNQEFVDFDIALYMTPITARLSMDDVVPRGHRVAFDLGDFIGLTPSPTGPSVQD